MRRKNSPNSPCALVAIAAQGGAYGGVHQQAAQEGAETAQVFPVQILHRGVVAVVVFLLEGLARGHLVVDAEEAGAHRDHHRGHGQRVQERGQEGRRQGEQQAQADLRFHAQQNSGKGI